LTVTPVAERIFSADSHITEPPDCYTRFIDPAFREDAPHIVHHESKGDLYVIPGMNKPIAIGPLAAAGIPSDQLKTFGKTFDQLHRSGWDPKARAADQVRDGVSGEILYPTVGMLICNHKDLAYKQACMDAYNCWIAEYCAEDPDRLFGLGQSALLSVEKGIDDLVRMKELGLKGIMMPGFPGDSYNGNTPDYDDPYWDPFFRASVELRMPISFHILTMGAQKHRGPKIASFMSIIRGNQDVIAMFVLGGVFERNPDLTLVCSEADAGWIPHFMYRMDHAVDREGGVMGYRRLSKMPSEFCLDHVRLTFQDDWVAFKMCRLDDTPMHRMLTWASDFPHLDSTWPWSQELLTEHTNALTQEELQAILHDNLAAVYDLPTSPKG
jgi:predicted TIM-barrel fold metal-dependent hydrolase